MPTELQIEAHACWLSTNGEQGKQLNLAGQDLRSIDLGQIDLRQAILERTSLAGAYVAGAKFGGANLRLTDFKGANVKDADFSEADLRDADLSDVTGLTAEQLMRTNLAGAKLPEPIQAFEGLAHVEASAGIARPLFLLNIILCIYAIAVINSTTDAALLTNAPSSVLPDISTPIPTKGFYYLSPIILLSLYVYFQIHVQQLIYDISRLPAIFPDGIPVTRKIYPWVLLVMLARNVSKRKHIIADRSSRLRTLTNFFVIILAWWLTPATLAMIWLKFLPAHDWPGGLLIIALTAGAVGAGGFGIQALEFPTPGSSEAASQTSWKKPKQVNRVNRAVTALVGVLMLVVTYGAYHGARASGASSINPKSWVPAMLGSLGLRAFADFSGIDVSSHAGGEGVNLAGRDMAYMDANSAVMASAILENANLAGANLEAADLRAAQLSNANLHDVIARGVNLAHANLRGAMLDNATVTGADLGFATLSDASVRSVVLSATNMRCARAHDADFTRSDLKAVVASRARFNEAQFIDADLTGGSFVSANFESALLAQSNLQGAIFDDAVFTNADLSNAMITEASFRKVDFTGASLSGIQTAKPTQPPSFLPDFSGADLEFSVGLTQEALNGACGDANTRLPDGLFIQACQSQAVAEPDHACGGD